MILKVYQWPDHPDIYYRDAIQLHGQGQCASFFFVNIWEVPRAN